MTEGNSGDVGQSVLTGSNPDLGVDEGEIAATDPSKTEPVADKPQRWTRLRWLFTRRLCFVGLCVGLVFFFLSMTPSLVPRTWLFQGLVSGFSVVIGYGIGSAISATVRRFRSNEPSTATKRTAWRVLAVAVVVLGLVALWFGAVWQNRVRRLMEMEPLEAYEWGAILISTLLVAALMLLVSRVVRGGARAIIGQLERWIPRRTAMVGGVVIASVVVLGLVQGVLFDGMVSAVNSSYSVIDKGTNPGISQPTSALRSGGTDSEVEWSSLGIKGRDFAGVGNGPTVADIEAFTGRPAQEPIRVYVGLQSADTLDQQVDLAMRELERTGAFERSVVAVMTTTGTGWVDENVSDSLEFLHDGDTAEVAMQYSYLPSWVSFLVDRSKAASAGRELVAAVSERIDSLPEGERPRLLVFGESLGSYGTEEAFTDLDDLRSRTDGALLVGPTFTNTLHDDLTGRRDEGSPVWRPILDGGNAVRFAVAPSDLTSEDLFSADAEWNEPRVVYLKNSSDPITYFSPSLLWRPPEWLDGEVGPDVDPDMVWVPIVSFWQVAADLAFSMGVPDGHGHRYGANVVDGWVQISASQDWTDADTEALRQLINERADERAKRNE